MASEERDRNFDQALARHLRSAAAANGVANAPAGSASESSACPDAETLAAYHERSLLPGELKSSKEHIVDCKKCQMILSHLEETDVIPLEASEEEEVSAETELASVAAAATGAATPMVAVTGRSGQKPDAATPRPDRTRRLRLLHGTRWRWLAPAGAIAASLLVWIALHENQPALPTAPEETKIAKNLPPPTLPIADKPALATPQSSGAAATGRPLSNGVASSNGRSESYGLAEKQKQVPPPALKSPPVAGHAGDLDAKAVGGAVPDTVELQAQAQSNAHRGLVRAQDQEQAANNQIQNQSNATIPKVPGPAPLNQATEVRRMKAAPPAPASPAAATDAAMNYQSSQSLELTKMLDARLIVAPGSNVFWRTGPAGLIEISTDSGATWSRQTSGVLVDLFAGSAVSDKICWVVGRAGAVLLTTDGGAHWKSLASSLNEDLGGIRATDALHATVWNLRHTKSFETTDGGATWKRNANP